MKNLIFIIIDKILNYRYNKKMIREISIYLCIISYFQKLWTLLQFRLIKIKNECNYKIIKFSLRCNKMNHKIGKKQ